MSEFNQDLIKEINLLRTNPKQYASKLTKYLNYFNDKFFCLPESNLQIQTEEGIEAFKEAIEFLNTQTELSPLNPCPELNQIAEEYISESIKNNSSELNDEEIEKIINKYGNYFGFFYRAIDFGGENPEMTVIDLIVSDGDSSRKQRETLFNSEINLIGVANCKHDIYRHCSGVITCSEFEINRKKNEQTEIKDKKIKEIKIRKPLVVTSVDKSEKIIVEDGDKKKETKIVKHMEDGSKQIAIIKEIFDD